MSGYDASTGEQQWSVPVRRRGGVRLSVSDGRVYLAVDGGRRVLSAVTGEELDGAPWREGPGWPQHPHPDYRINGDQIVAEGVDGERWRASAGGDGGIAVEAGDVVLVSTGSGLRVLRQDTGAVVGELRVHRDFDPRPAISAGDRAWVALVDGSVWCLALAGEGEPLPEPEVETGDGTRSHVERVPLDRLIGALGLAPNDGLVRRSATRTVDEPRYLAAIVDWAITTLQPVLGAIEPLGTSEVTTEVAITIGTWLSTAWDLPVGSVDLDLTDGAVTDATIVGGAPAEADGAIGEVTIDGEAVDGLADRDLTAQSLWRLLAEAAEGAGPVRYRGHLLVAGSEALAFHALDVPIDRYGSPFAYLNACGVAVVRSRLWQIGNTALDVAAGVSQGEPYRRPEGWDRGRSADLAEEAMLRTPAGWDDPFSDGLRAVRADPECGWATLEQWLLESSGLDDVEPLLDEARSTVADLVPGLRIALRLHVLALLAAAGVARVAAQLAPAGRADLLGRARRNGRDALAALIDREAF